MSLDTKSTLAISEIQLDIQVIEEDMSLYEETNFYSRAEAIDFIDFHVVDRIEGLLQKEGPNKKLGILKQRAEKVKRALEKINTNLFRQFREKIRAGAYAKSSFRKIVRKYLRCYVGDISQPDKIGYDNLDVFINGLLAGQAMPEATKEREVEMVFYQKTPARIVFGIAELAEISQNDVFFDLGSGLGQVAILVNLISGVTTIGIEYEPTYCSYAKACASQLNLFNVEFINADVRKGDYSQGTIFFMYTPFEGRMLEDMLEILEKESRKRMIRIFTYGNCSVHVSRQSWLNCINGKADNPYKLYEFKSLNAVRCLK